MSNADHFTWKVPDNEFTRNKKVTLRYLLSHQAGIPPSDLISTEEGKPLPTLPQVLSGEKPALNPAAIPEFEPGSQWCYSNVGYIVVQMILEDVIGKPFAKIAEEVLFKPLKMKSSSFSYPLKTKNQKREAMPHGTDGSAKTPCPADGLAVTPGSFLSGLHIHCICLSGIRESRNNRRKRQSGRPALSGDPGQPGY